MIDFDLVFTESLKAGDAENIVRRLRAQIPVFSPYSLLEK